VVISGLSGIKRGIGVEGKEIKRGWGGGRGSFDVDSENSKRIAGRQVKEM